MKQFLPRSRGSTVKISAGWTEHSVRGHDCPGQTRNFVHGTPDRENSLAKILKMKYNQA